MNADMPFGGVGMSGYGRYHGIEGFKAFSNPKGVMHKPPLNVFPYNQIYPPFDKMKQFILKNLMRLRGVENPMRWFI
jgi:hypothetical protein